MRKFNACQWKGVQNSVIEEASEYSEYILVAVVVVVKTCLSLQYAAFDVGRLAIGIMT